MSLAFEDDKILTSNPFIDLLLYNLKILSFNSIIKDQYTANNSETIDSIKNSDLYIACYENRAEVALFNYIPHDILVEAGVPEEQIKLYENNDEYDPYYLPEKYHEAILKLAQPWYMEQYVELNEYYRLITGQPPLGDPGIPMRDYEYLLSDDLLDYTGEFVHETGTDFCRMLENMGILDIIKADFPDAKYLDYVTQGLDIYTVRMKLDFQLLYYPDDCDLAVTQEFLFKYEENRKYVLATVYSNAMELESEYYHSFIMIYLIIITMLDMLMEVQSHIVKKDILDRRCIQYIFSIYGIPYYRVIPYKYQERMCKNVWSLVKYKSCTQEMLNLIDLFGFDDIHIFKYYILKVRRTNAWGEYEYNSNTKLVCRYNDIIEHTTLEENLSDPSTQPPIPPNLDWYEDSTVDGQSIVDNSRNLISYNDEDKVKSSTIEALDNDALNYEYDKDNRDFIATLAEGDVVRYINYPFDYFLQKGNVMFVKVDGRVLVEGVDYTISNYNTITFHNGVTEGKSKVTYEFYYDKETIDKDFNVDTDHAIEMDTKQWKNCRTGQIFDLDPIKWSTYFPNQNQVIVTVSSVFIPPALYLIDYDNHTVTIDSSVSIDGRVVTIIMLYSKSLRTQFEKHNVEAVQDEQTDFFIPEPFQHYCLNENDFFVTMGSIYVNQDRYTIKPSTEEGRSLISFTDGTRVPRGRSITFNFLYSTNAIWNPLIVETKTIHIVATQFYQTQFDIDFPVNNYVDCRYKVFIKLLGWYLPEEMFEVVGNGITFLDQSIALQPDDEMDVILVYVNSDRSSGNSNIKVSTDYRVADQDKQSTYDIVFPTDHYHTKGNEVLIDVEGIYLTEGTDYEIDYNDANGGKEGTLTLKTYDYKPMKGQRVNYTFYWNQEAEYYASLDQQQIPIEEVGQDTFTLEFPFFPYTQTGNDFVVMSGSTIVTKDRISWVDQFNIKIDGLDITEAGGYITVLYIYNNYYLLNQEPDLIVEWKDAPILSDRDYVEVPVPFDQYIENDWPYFVTHGDRQYLEDDKYEIYNSSWYANPTSDKDKYGNNITFTFIYLIREPWVEQVVEEDYAKDMDLVFCKIPIEDLYSSQYLKDPTNYKDYDAVVYQDGWWDGVQYKQNNHQEVIDAIYREKWNYARSKYYGLFQTMDVVKYSSMISYFYAMLYDDVFLEEEIKIKVDSLSPYHTFRLADLFIYMTCLTYIFNGLEDFVLDVPPDRKIVQAFNFRASFKELQKCLRYHHEHIEKFDVWDFIIPTEQIPDLESLMNILQTNWDVRTDLIQDMIDSEDYREYHIWKHFYEELMTWELNFKFFELENGEVAETYTQFLQEKDSVLYNSLQEIKAMGNYEEQLDYIVQIVDDIVYVLDEFINGEWDCVFDRFPGQSPTDALKYLLLVISFFKSYKIVFLTKGIQMNIGGDGTKPDEDTFFKGMDLCRIRKTDNIITYYPLVEHIQTTRHLGFKERFREHENGKWMREDFTITRNGRWTSTKDINGTVTINPIYYDKDLITNGSLIIEKQEFNKDIITDGMVTINKEDFTYDLFGGNTITFEYVQGEDNADIDSDTIINKEDFYIDILTENQVELIRSEYTGENDGTIDGDLELVFTEYDGVDNGTIDGQLELVFTEYDGVDDGTIDGELNIDKLYPSEDELNDHYTITGTVDTQLQQVDPDDEAYIIVSDVKLEPYQVDPEDPNYLIDGQLNINPEYPTDEELEDHYTITGEVSTELHQVDENDPAYIIDGELNVDKLYPSEDDEDYIIDSDVDLVPYPVDPEDPNYLIDGMININAEYPTDEELNDHYTITGTVDTQLQQVDPNDKAYIINSDLNIDRESIDVEDPRYNIDGDLELVFTEYTGEDDGTIDGELNINAEYPLEDDEAYIISGELDIEGFELPDDDSFAIEGTVTIDKQYIPEDNSDYIIEGNLNIDKSYPTDDEYNDHYTIDGDLDIKGIIVEPDEGYTIDGTVNIDAEYPSEDDDTYIIDGNMTYEQGQLEEDNPDYIIEGTVELDSELEFVYDLDSDLIVNYDESNSDIDSDVTINKHEFFTTVGVEFEVPNQEFTTDIDGNMDLINTDFNTILLNGELNVDNEEYYTDINGDLNINQESIDEDVLVEFIVPNQEFTTDIDGELEIEENESNTDIDGTVDTEDEEFTTDIDGTLDIGNESLDTDVTVEFEVPNQEFSTDIDGGLNINNESIEEDIDGNLNVDNEEFTTDIDGTVELINRTYVKQNVLDGYEYIRNTTSSGGGVQTNITGRLYYSSVNRAYEIENCSVVYGESTGNYDLNGSVELYIPYEGFTITNITTLGQQGVANRNVESTITFPVTVTVSDISHLVNDNGEFYDSKAVSMSMADTYISYRSFEVTGVNVGLKQIYILVTLTGTWANDSQYGAIFYITDDTGIRVTSSMLIMNVTVYDEPDQPVDPNASITIDSSTENDRRWQSYDSYTNGRYNISSGYGGWDVTLNNITTEYLDLQNITMSIVSCSNSSSSGALRSVTFDGTTDKGTNTKFGLNFSISDSISTRNANYDYTLEVNVPVTNGYSGTLTTQFTIKLYIY